MSLLNPPPQRLPPAFLKDKDVRDFMLSFAKSNYLVWESQSTSEQIVQEVITTDGEVATGTTQMPVDDSIPQITEGDEYMTVTITPKSATNKLIIEALLHGSHSVNNTFTIALFKDSVTNALAVGRSSASAAATSCGSVLKYEMTAGTTSLITFRIRAGTNAAGTFTFNGAAGTRQFGGIYNSYIKVTEIR